MKTDLFSIAKKVGKLLREKKLILATAESCTGGFISHIITNVPGSSKYFDRGIVVYSNEAKIETLGVLKESIEKHGAVSKKIAEEMAEGIQKRSNAGVGMAITGIAGPDGGTPEKPVGLVFIAICINGDTTLVENLFNGTRKEIKKKTAIKAFELLLKRVQELC